MKRQLISLVALILVVAGTLTGVAYLRNSQEATRQNEASAAQRGSLPDTNAQTPKTDAPGRYVTYSEAAFDTAQGRPVLFFHASWCPQCRMIEADIKKSAIPSEVTIFKVNYDSSQALRQEYDVTLQTTFVEVDHDGRLLAKYVAYNEPTFDSLKENLLNR